MGLAVLGVAHGSVQTCGDGQQNPDICVKVCAAVIIAEKTDVEQKALQIGRAAFENAFSAFAKQMYRERCCKRRYRHCKYLPVTLPGNKTKRLPHSINCGEDEQYGDVIVISTEIVAEGFKAYIWKVGAEIIRNFQCSVLQQCRSRVIEYPGVTGQGAGHAA